MKIDTLKLKEILEKVDFFWLESSLCMSEIQYDLGRRMKKPEKEISDSKERMIKSRKEFIVMLNDLVFELTGVRKEYVSLENIDDIETFTQGDN